MCRLTCFSSDETIKSTIPIAQSTPAADFSIDLQTPSQSSYVLSETQDSDIPTSKPLEKLNAFLESRDVSPVRYPLKTQWEEASERTRRRRQLYIECKYVANCLAMKNFVSAQLFFFGAKFFERRSEVL